MGFIKRTEAVYHRGRNLVVDIIAHQTHKELRRAFLCLCPLSAKMTICNKPLFEAASRVFMVTKFRDTRHLV